MIADLDAVGAARRRVASAVSEKTGMHTIGLNITSGKLSVYEMGMLGGHRKHKEHN